MAKCNNEKPFDFFYVWIFSHIKSYLLLLEHGIKWRDFHIFGCFKTSTNEHWTWTLNHFSNLSWSAVKCLKHRKDCALYNWSLAAIEIPTRLYFGFTDLQRIHIKKNHKRPPKERDENLWCNFKVKTEPMWNEQAAVWDRMRICEWLLFFFRVRRCENPLTTKYLWLYMVGWYWMNGFVLVSYVWRHFG